MRVLICIGSSHAPGGKERQTVELVKGLARRTDIECCLVCLDRDPSYGDELDGLAVPVHVGLRRRRWDVAVFGRLYKVVRRYRPHVIHTLDMMSSFFALPIARGMGIPLVNGSIRNAFPGGDVRWWLEKILLQQSDYRVANSYAGLQSRGFTESDRNVVISNGFDFSRVDRLLTDARPSANGHAARVKTVGMVAGFSRYKDYRTFIGAARQLSARRNELVFVAVGDGESLEASKKLAADVGTLKFLGAQKNVEEIVAAFDIGVLSTFTEGMSNSVLEYMALRKPVVATDGGGTREIVVDGETGFLVPPANPEALAAKIEYLLDHPDRARRMGEAGGLRIRREFSIGAMVEKTLHLYETALRRPLRARRGRND